MVRSDTYVHIHMYTVQNQLLPGGAASWMCQSDVVCGGGGIRAVLIRIKYNHNEVFSVEKLWVL